jgi:multidrug transporter EmrE-like cation transporter
MLITHRKWDDEGYSLCSLLFAYIKESVERWFVVPTLGSSGAGIVASLSLFWRSRRYYYIGRTYAVWLRGIGVDVTIGSKAIASLIVGFYLYNRDLAFNGAICIAMAFRIGGWDIKMVDLFLHRDVCSNQSRVSVGFHSLSEPELVCLSVLAHSTNY